MTLISDLISAHHAEIGRYGSRLTLRDLGSTNGTYLNGERLSEGKLVEEGDIMHFARFEFRLGKVGADEAEALLASTIAVDNELPQLMIDRSRVLREMMRRRDVTSLFQPIVALSDERALGYEVLGRGLMEGAETLSSEMFDTAQVLGAEAELSRLFREQSTYDCTRLPGNPIVFINTHPVEVGSPDLIESLREFRRQAPQVVTILEIHESAVASPQVIRTIHEHLKELDIGLAYDDFGAGQARLQELAEVQPDFLKFDASLIRNIHTAPSSRRRVLASLVELALDLGIAPIAEGVESEAEAEICRQIGFSLGQGYLFGAPAPISEIAG